MAQHQLILPADLHFQPSDEDAAADSTRKFRAVFARLDRDDLASAVAQCFGCSFRIIVYPQAFRVGQAAPFRVGHWSQDFLLPFGAGRVELAEGEIIEAALSGTVAPTPGAGEEAGRLAHQVGYGLGQVSAGPVFEVVREGDALTAAEAAVADAALDQASLTHVAAVETGAVRGTSIEFFARPGVPLDLAAVFAPGLDAACAAAGACGQPPPRGWSAERSQSAPTGPSACDLAEARAEAALLRGRQRRNRYDRLKPPQRTEARHV